MKFVQSLIPLCLCGSHVVNAFAPSSLKSLKALPLYSANNDVDDYDISISPREGRRGMLQKTLTTAGGFVWMPLVAEAKVEGYAPPKKSLPEEYRQGTLGLADMDDNAPIAKEAYKKNPSGLIYADLRIGAGAEVEEKSRVNLQWVMRKSNGYFVDSSAVSDSVPFIFVVGEKSAIKGVDEGVRGMRVGGTRRLLIPIDMAYVDGIDDGKPGPLPVGFGPRQQMRRVQRNKDVPGEYIFLEVQLTRMR